MHQYIERIVGKTIKYAAFHAEVSMLQIIFTDDEQIQVFLEQARMTPARTRVVLYDAEGRGVPYRNQIFKEDPSA